MIDSTQQIQVLQILYEIAISIGVSLDLQKMLKACVPTFLKKLNCSAAGVYHIVEHADHIGSIEQIYSIPRKIETSESYRAVRQQIPKQLTMQQLTDFRKRLPIGGQTETNSYFYILELPNFGVLTLMKIGDGLDPFILKSLTPLRKKLAAACTACLAEEDLKRHHDHLEDLVRERTTEIVNAMTAAKRLNEELRREIAERQRAEKQLLQLQKAVETTGVGITITNNEGRIVYSNPANAAMHGYDVEEVLNQPPRMFSAPNAETALHPPQIPEEDAASFHWKRERTSLRKDGSTFPARLTSTLIVDAAEKRLGRVTICEDISEQKEAEARLLAAHNELKEKNAQLAELNASKDKFFSIISHDLRNPFNILLGYSNLLAENIERYSPAEIKSRAQKLQTSARKLYTLLENLLTWSRIQRGAMKYEPEAIRLNELFEDILDLLLSQAEHKNIALHSSIPPDIQVYADHHMLHTVLRNLLSNALKFTPAEGRVDISARADGAVVEIAIADSGVGIDPADLPRLFRIDSQYTQQGTAGEKGSGLGLSLCRDLVEKNHGRIWVDSVIDQGTTFTFSIPKFQG